jgi:hypothetical protein
VNVYVARLLVYGGAQCLAAHSLGAIFLGLLNGFFSGQFSQGHLEDQYSSAYNHKNTHQNLDDGRSTHIHLITEPTKRDTVHRWAEAALIFTVIEHSKRSRAPNGTDTPTASGASQ